MGKQVADVTLDHFWASSACGEFYFSKRVTHQRKCGVSSIATTERRRGRRPGRGCHRTWTRASLLRRAICETWCATGVCCDGSGLGVGASPVGVAAIGATSTCGTADGFACAAAHCRLPRSWHRLSRVLPRSWDHLIASNGNTRRSAGLSSQERQLNARRC